MSTQPARISYLALEKEVERLKEVTARDKQLLERLQSQIIRGRLDFLDMEEKWEKERQLRMKMEHAFLKEGYELSIVDEADDYDEYEEVVSAQSSTAGRSITSSQSMGFDYSSALSSSDAIFERGRSPSTPLTAPEDDDEPPAVPTKVVVSQKRKATSSSARRPRPTVASTMAEEASLLRPLKRKRTSLPQTQTTVPTTPSKSSHEHNPISRGNFTSTPISPPSLPVSISRRALSQSIGVPQRIPRWHSADHFHRFLFPTSKYQPHAPSNPGTSGRILDLSMDGYRGGPWSVFYQLGDERAKKTMIWGYAGEYMASDGGEADERDWAFLADATKKSYAERVVKSRTPGPTLDIRSRISFRKVNCQRTPSTKELQRYTTTLVENGFDDELVAEEVDLAFDVGHEHLRYVQLTFINYDHDRARELIKAQEDFLESQDSKEGIIKMEPAESSIPAAPNGSKSKSKSKSQSKSTRGKATSKTAPNRTTKLALSSSSTRTSTGDKPPKVYVELPSPGKRVKVDRGAA